jgi:hypothetical protein
MPVRLTLGDLGAPGWGEPWFPLRVLLLLSHGLMYGDVFALFGVLFGFLAPYTTLYDDAQDISLPTELAVLTMPFLRFVCFLVWLFGVLFLV